MRRVRRLLVFVPFTFPAWLRLRAEDPVAAAGMRFELALNLAQSVLLVFLACFVWWYVANYDVIVAVLVRLVLGLLPAQ